MGRILTPKLRKRRVMRRKDARGLMEEAATLLSSIRPSIIEKAELDGTQVYFIDGAAMLARAGAVLFPTLMHPDLEVLPSVVVDMGAVPYICNGADVMAPGIVEIQGEFEESELIVVRDIRHEKALALGMAQVKSEEMRRMKKGKAVRNLHYVGDKLWKTIG